MVAVSTARCGDTVSEDSFVTELIPWEILKERVFWFQVIWGLRSV